MDGVNHEILPGASWFRPEDTHVESRDGGATPRDVSGGSEVFTRNSQVWRERRKETQLGDFKTVG